MPDDNHDRGKVCTCDDIGDSPCPVHQRENALQDRAIAAENKLDRLRDLIRYDLVNHQHSTDYWGTVREMEMSDEGEYVLWEAVMEIIRREGK